MRSKASDKARGASASARRGALSTRTSSIARSIAVSIWVRRLIWFIVLDMALGIALVGAFVFQSIQELPKSARSGALLAPGTTWQLSAPRFDLAALELRFSDDDGHARVFLLSDHLGPTIAVLSVILIGEIVSLASGASEARRIRRKLRPLNALALSAEAIGAEAGRGPLTTTPDARKFENLEHAISAASVDAPRVATGDKDLRSIEVALNGLLRRMQQAKAQQARFISDASHELRTPLAVIEGYVGMLDRWGKGDPAVLDESITALKGESAHMRELVEQLLFLARGDSGRNALRNTTFDLGELVAEVSAESRMIDSAHRYVARHADADAADEGACLLFADRALIKQSMRIIVQNAARYSPADTAIELVARSDPAGGYVGYEVQDLGMGIAEAEARHIFERFYRADEARDAHREGTGLGLAIAKWIVEAHGGEINVVSHVDLGTRFTVWLPRETSTTTAARR